MRVLLAATLLTACSYDWDGPLRDRGDASAIDDADGREASDADSALPPPPDAQPDTCASICCAPSGLCKDTSVTEDTSQGPCTGLKPGVYCGKELLLDPNYLFKCGGGAQTTGSQKCTNGCTEGMGGMTGMDYCTPTPDQ